METLKNQCSHYPECDAPLCPMNQLSLIMSIWYSDEDICKLKKYADLQWIKNQKRIKLLRIPPESYFNIKMLNTRFRMTQALKGIDPEIDYADHANELAKWLKRHPALKERSISESSLEALKNASCNRPVEQKDDRMIDPPGDSHTS